MGVGPSGPKKDEPSFDGKEGQWNDAGIVMTASGQDYKYKGYGAAGQDYESPGYEAVGQSSNQYYPGAAGQDYKYKGYGAAGQDYELQECEAVGDSSNQYSYPGAAGQGYSYKGYGATGQDYDQYDSPGAAGPNGAGCSPGWKLSQPLGDGRCYCANVQDIHKRFMVPRCQDANLSEDQCDCMPNIP